MSSEYIKGLFLKTRVLVWDVDASRRLWSNGFYGKPLGIPKPKSPDFSAPLLLDLLEAVYLVEKNILKVYDVNGKEMGIEGLMKNAEKTYHRFKEKYMVYKDLREKGYIVLSGLKFGVDFAVYEKGPGLEHAPYLIDVVISNDKISGDELVRAGRLATTVRKRFIIAIPNKQANKVDYMIFSWWKP